MLTCYPITRPVRTTEPTPLEEPLTVAEARHQCGIAEGNSYHDTDLQNNIAAARQKIEYDTGIVCFTGIYTWKLTQWPDSEWLEIRCLRPVTSITSIAYLDGSGASQTLGASNYALEPSTVVPLVRLTYANTWPAIRGDINGITLTIVAGYATVLAIPAVIKKAAKVLVHVMWLNDNEQGQEAMRQYEAYERLLTQLDRRTYP